MKRILSLFLALLFCLSALSLVSSCSSKHPIEKFADKLEASNYYFLINISSIYNISGVEKASFGMEVDGNIQYIQEVAELGIKESYIETIGKRTFLYTMTSSQNATWKKTNYNDEIPLIISTNDLIHTFFNPRDYEKVSGEKNTYKFKSNVNGGGFEDAVLKIEKDTCTIEVKMDIYGYTPDVQMIISKIGEIKLALPVVS